MPMQPSSVLRLDTGTQTTLQKQNRNLKAYERSKHRYLQFNSWKIWYRMIKNCTTETRSRSPTDSVQSSELEICKNEVK